MSSQEERLGSGCTGNIGIINEPQVFEEVREVFMEESAPEIEESRGWSKWAFYPGRAPVRHWEEHRLRLYPPAPRLRIESVPINLVRDLNRLMEEMHLLRADLATLREEWQGLSAHDRQTLPTFAKAQWMVETVRSQEQQAMLRDVLGESVRACRTGNLRTLATTILEWEATVEEVARDSDRLADVLRARQELQGQYGRQGHES